MDVTTGSNTVLSETAGGYAEERRALFMIDFRCPDGVAILNKYTKDVAGSTFFLPGGINL
jgi:hypothetical protein